ncbi:NAD(P)/FAD-dependent oxidoreductase [Herbaspirillum rubrisubalbicans]|uniref:FAD-binding oxidoreductase n=1 Tax=Herbaspirillum rubrisubalbicans TaxID=80842 RepID=A0AAD0UH79_9BURK|nr:FAD-binding oxidoreductase [Herbaspirillum rubrisubalbicans]AYR26994.1 FAD-binding oxidoreductase [Herbaspirillum rubrisubalbicans]
MTHDFNAGQQLSLWSATGGEIPVTPPLQASARYDVAIIGAGYTGLSTALHLAEAGVSVCVLDTHAPGWGASGRNGGQVIPGLKYDPDQLRVMFGSAVADPLIAAIGSAADTVFDLIARHGIDCDAHRGGWIQPTHSPKVMRALESRARQWMAEGAPAQLMDGAEVARRIGTDAYVGGWKDERAGSLHPLKYCRGLARAAQRLGVAIHGNTRVAQLERRQGGWRVHSAQGPHIDADQVVLATNGYTDDLWPHLRQSVIAANSFIVATQPLSPQLGASILPAGEVTSDSRRLLLYYRRDAQGRLLMGGRGPFGEPRGVDDFAHLERSVALLFPQLAGVSFEYRWSGRVAITRDFMPHVHEPAPGLTAAVGYNGRGIAMASTMGRCLAQRLRAQAGAVFPFPVSTISPIPLHGLQRFYIAAGVAWYSVLDRFS